MAHPLVLQCCEFTGCFHICMTEIAGTGNSDANSPYYLWKVLWNLLCLRTYWWKIPVRCNRSHSFLINVGWFASNIPRDYPSLIMLIPNVSLFFFIERTFLYNKCKGVENWNPLNISKMSATHTEICKNKTSYLNEFSASTVFAWDLQHM